MSIPTMESVFLSKVVERAACLGADSSEILRGSLLRTEVLQGPSTPIPCASVYLASSRAAELSGNRFLCAELGEQYDWSSGFAMPLSLGERPSLGDMLLAWLQFTEHVQESMRYRLTVEGHKAQLSGRRFVMASHPPGQADAWDLASWVQMFGRLIGSTWKSASVEAAVFDPKAIPSRLIPEAQVKESDAWGLGITFPSSWLMERIKRPDYGNKPDLHLSDAAVDLSQLFDTLDYASWPGSDGFAKFLGLHPKAFQRSLAERGTNCTALVDAAKSRLASKWVSDREMPFNEIAKRLGYRNPSAFTRACHRWFGCAPDEIRSRSELKN
ncbi:helix-turn-helix domain-containing protein [Lutimaribacter marinistellae]|uniref:Helix-turn-helix domain-containing protein n=1 Tax=Lutimaribacter marinistellae TaxID=1820329 RepID=A0ABV7TDL3_9RHOB